ncbi:hypothetical protein [Pseudomonas tohonis]|uniref:hypothetical protein n=1 Tax=Pseudomonas tohonis TaxID=2725477 RepID=UPI001F492813|nr:hypothetical protein [Pseudomonas tohonis]
MRPHVILEWSFKPADYFGSDRLISTNDYQLKIETGKATATIDAETYASTPNLKEKINTALHDQLLGLQVFYRKEFKLSAPNKIEVDESGLRTSFTTIHIPVQVGVSVELSIEDEKGNIIYDSREEKKALIRATNEKAEILGSRISEHRLNDPTIASMATSYSNSVTDSTNEFIHLYEILESLSERFGTLNSAIKRLNLNDKDRNEFGKICNKLPVRQGRHRGKTPGSLRDATEAELDFARSFSIKMIEAYLDYLDAQKLNQT